MVNDERRMNLNILLLWIIFLRFSKQYECPNNKNNTYYCEGYYRKRTTQICDGPPRFTTGKTPGYWIARTEKSPVELKCSACGNPKPTIKWYKRNQYIDPNVKKAKYKVHGYQLDIDSLSTEETGNYTCVVENEHGSINFTYLLEVLMNRVMAPVIVGPTNQTVQAGTDARFECKVLASDLQHHTQWLQHYTVNGSYRDYDGQPYVNIIQQTMINITQPEVLIIKNVTTEDAGWYTCLISNPMGRDYQSAWLTVIEQSTSTVLTTGKISKGKNQSASTVLTTGTLSKGKETATLSVNYTSHPNLQFTDAWTEESGKHRITSRSALLYGLPSTLSFILVAVIVICIRWKMTCTCRIKWKIKHEEDVSETVNSNDGYEMIDESLLGVQPSSGTQHQFSRLNEGPSTDDDSARDSHNYFQPIAENNPPLPYKYDYVDDVVPVPISANDASSTESDDSEHLRNSIDYLDPISRMNSSSTSGSDVSDVNAVPILSIDDYLHPYNTPDPDWRYKTHLYSEYKEQTDGYVNHNQTTLDQGIQTKLNVGQSYTVGKKKHVFQTLDKPINRDEVVNLNESETKDIETHIAEYQTVFNAHESKLADEETNDYDDVMYIF